MGTPSRSTCLLFVLLATGFGAGAAEPSAQEQAQGILAATGVRGGLIVHVGCGDGRLTAALRASDAFLVFGLDADPANVAKAREHIHARGLDGKVTADRLAGDHLPLIDDVANLIVAEDLGAVPMAEVMRVLCPNGVACLKRGGNWAKTVKPRPKDIDEWTHYLHDPSNNAVAHDARVGPPHRMQWLADPSWTRNHHTLASISSVVSSAGRVFYIVDDATGADMNIAGHWSVVGRDAFNGKLLWKRPIDTWAWHRRGFRSGPVQLPRTLVAVGGRVFVPLGLGAPVSALDAATGKTVRTYEATDNAEEAIVHDGVLLAIVGAPAAEQAGIGPTAPPKMPFPNHKAIAAVRAETGDTLWRWTEPEGVHLMPLTLAAAGSRAFFQAGRGVVCLDLASGKEQWRSGELSQDKPKAGEAGSKKKGRRRRGLGSRSLGWSVATLVVSDGVVLWANGGRLTALAADTGKSLWDCPCPAGFRSPSDVFAINGLVWLGSGFSEGRDLRTGAVKRRTNALRLVQTAGHHHRCYREKASDRYIMASHRGIEFLDLVGTNHTRNNWIRGVCQYGIMPCNGLIYAPAHTCGCYMEAKLFGFWAVAAERRLQVPGSRFQGERLEKGPAYGAIGNRQSAIGNPEEWPTYRRDALRSGATAAAVPAKLARAWAAKLGGRLSAPVVAGGLVVVASVDAHRVIALGAADGKLRWTFQAGGRVDSPPTLHQGLVLFGSADGFVYALRASDGALAWRFRAAPGDRRTVAYDQVESVWPVHGSVLVERGVAYVGAGRSSYLDGGIALYGLDPATGKVVCETRVRSDQPDIGDPAKAKEIQAKKIAQNTVDYKTLTAPDLSDSFSMAGGTRTDVLVSDGASIYLRQMRFSPRLERQTEYGRHLFSTTTLLDDTEIHRTHRVLGSANFSRIPVAYSWIANSLKPRWGVQLAEPYGLILVFDGQMAWGIRRAGGYTLFAEAHGPLPAKEEPPPDFRPPAKGAPPRWAWSVKVPLRPRALVRAGDRLILGGMPRMPGAAAEPAFLGRKGGALLIASAKDGAAVASYALDAPPVWDAIAAAGGRLYVVTTDGAVACLAADGATPLKPYEASAAAAPAAAPAAGPRGGRGRPGAPIRPDQNGKLVLKPETARTTGRLTYQPDRDNLGAWTNPRDYCEWHLKDVKAGAYTVDFAYGTARGGIDYTIVVGDERLAGKTEDTGGIKTYQSYRVGTIKLPGGACTLAVKPGPFTGAIMNFRLLTLTPAR